MQKIYLTKLFFDNAMHLTEYAEKAQNDGWIDVEAGFSVGAHIMCAFTLEGLINEVGERVLTRAAWDGIEKLDMVAKWFVISHFLRAGSFEYGAEPLSTVNELRSIRNRLAHPKGMPPGDEIIVRNSNGLVRRDVTLDYVLQDNDVVFLGVGKLIIEFNTGSAQRAVRRTISALRALKEKVNDQVPNDFLGWVDKIPANCAWLKE